MKNLNQPVRSQRELVESFDCAEIQRLRRALGLLWFAGTPGRSSSEAISTRHTAISESPSMDSPRRAWRAAYDRERARVRRLAEAIEKLIYAGKPGFDPDMRTCSACGAANNVNKRPCVGCLARLPPAES